MDGDIPMADLDKAALLKQVNELYNADDFIGIIELLSPMVENLDYDLALELARAYINTANTQDSTNTNTLCTNEELYLSANALLDKYALSGKDHATYLFYKGYALFKLGLTNDALLRLQRALKFIKFGSEDKLLPTIQRMISLCESFDPDNNDLSLSKDDEISLDEHIRLNFGKYQIIFKTDRYELINVPPTEERPFNLILTKGLAGKKIKVPAGVDELTNSRIELALCLPKEWEFSNSESYNLWPINTLCELINYILTTDEFIGFGYSFAKGKPLHPSTDFSGGILTALGAFDKKAQELTLSDNSLVRFFELIFLFPSELEYRSKHSASELLELFQLKKVIPSPVRKRMDVCIQVVPANKI